MGYLLFQMFLYMLAAFLLGLLLGWLLWGRLKARFGELDADSAPLQAEIVRLQNELDACGEGRADLAHRLREAEAQVADLRARRSAPSVQAVQAAVSQPPAQLTLPMKAEPVARKAPTPKKPAAPSKTAKAADDLRKMIGIGPVNERLLHKAGVTTYEQIATWTPADVARIEEVLQFDGRIEREHWIEQARLLAAGDEQEFLRRFPSAATDKNS